MLDPISMLFVLLLYENQENTVITSYVKCLDTSIMVKTYSIISSGTENCENKFVTD